jgi:hypothetical protein
LESSGIVARALGSVASPAAADETSAVMVGETSGRRRRRVDFVA